VTAAVFAAVFAALYAAHMVGDHWIQTGWQAACKGSRDRAGRVACAAHVASLTATKLAFVSAAALVLGLPWHPVWLAAGLAVDAVSHYWADRRFTLAWLAATVERAGINGKAEFYRLGAPRPVRGFVLDPTDPGESTLLDVLTYEVDNRGIPVHPEPGRVIPRQFDNPSNGTGAYALDQSWHIGWLFIAALVIAAGAA
jgi:hypothetical protein